MGMNNRRNFEDKKKQYQIIAVAQQEVLLHIRRYLIIILINAVISNLKMAKTF